MAFSQSFATNPSAILSRLDAKYKNLEELEGKIVSVPKEFYHEEILRTKYPNIQLHLTNDPLESIKAVIYGDADATLGQLAVLNYLIRSNFISGVTISGEVTFEDGNFEDIYMTTQFEDKELLSILNKGIASLTLEEENLLINKWLAPTREDILELTDRIKVEVDNTLKRPDKVDPTRVEITMKQGDIYSKQVEDPLGSLQRPMSFNDCANKFSDCANLLDAENTNRVIELIGKLEEVEDVGEIIGLLTEK